MSGWTQVLPTVAGWYWVRDVRRRPPASISDECDVPDIDYVLNYIYQSPRRGMVFIGAGRLPSDTKAWEGKVEFQGPVPGPVE